MVRPAVAVAVTVVLVLSGCVGAAEPGAIGQGFSGDPDNHWQESVLTVSYEAPAGDDRDYRPLVHEALVYWTEHSERHAGYDVSFRHAEPGETADVHVEFVDSVGDCGAAAGARTAGCAPVITKSRQVSRPVGLEVQTNLSDESTVAVLKHELGHTLGLTHDDGPAGVMNATIDLETLPRTDAGDRATPWRSDDLDVYVDVGAAPDPAAAERQVGAALRYYIDGASGTVPEDVTFYRTDSPENADVVVRYAGSDACRDAAGSCGTVSGDDVDGDDALEYHDRLEIVLVDLETDAVAWHVGRWLGTGFGQDDASEYPDPLRPDKGYAERRSTWWE
ncbi:matrixin family metalloprotease [Natronomonas salina]|uniref:matrixin family metalloprotease n=1 Tax=Natronomonas salina TaxID=1710540 RepID=UPI001FE88713|nr:matrixin family metalloprotease [Natronomonas salina]